MGRTDRPEVLGVQIKKQNKKALSQRLEGRGEEAGGPRCLQ